ncbi:nickel ABC transporter permease [Lachnospiraceae bacterium 45-P1]
MLRYTGKRLLQMVFVLLGVSFIIFCLMEITPGDPARQILGPDASEEAVLAMREELRLDDPFAVRYISYIAGVLHGDFGTSYTTKEPVIHELFARYPTTVLFAVLTVLIASLIGIPLGIISATKQYSWVDSLSTSFAMLGVSIPTFWLGLMLMLLFALRLEWLPATGFYGPIYWILPAITVGLPASAGIIRMTRSSMLEVVRLDYIRTARAKGQTERKIIYGHALENAMIPVITVVGITFGQSLGGQIVTEQVFAVPGLGKLMVEAINARNYPVVEGGVLLIAFAYCVINLLVDIIYAYLDPRIKSQYSSSVKKRMKKEAAAHEG